MARERRLPCRPLPRTCGAHLSRPDVLAEAGGVRRGPDGRDRGAVPGVRRRHWRVTAARAPTTASVLDISLRNDGDLPALVTQIRVTLRQADQLLSCTGQGGAEGIAARYTVTIPDDRSRPSEVIERPVRFEVGPRAVERFTVSVGPEVSLANQLYVTDIDLVQDSGQLLRVGTAAFAAPAAIPRDPGQAVDTACVAAMQDLLGRAERTRGAVSPRLPELRKQFEDLLPTDCGAVAPGRLTTTGGVTCDDARAIVSQYGRRAAREGRGSRAAVTVQGWDCAYVPLPDRASTNDLLGCVDRAGRVLRVTSG